MDISYI